MTDQELMVYLGLTDEQRINIMKEPQNRIESQSNPKQEGGRKKKKNQQKKNQQKKKKEVTNQKKQTSC